MILEIKNRSYQGVIWFLFGDLKGENFGVGDLDLERCGVGVEPRELVSYSTGSNIESGVFGRTFFGI